MENMKKIMGIKHRWLVTALVCLISLGAISMAGCAGSTKTSTVTTQTTNGASGGGSTTSVTTQKETSAHPRGVIGGLFYVIGQVLIWPFKAIASLF
jgi:hypothetical protein